MSLEISSIKRALASLERAINVVTSKKGDTRTSIDEIKTIEAGVIQNFEFTYELCWKFMKRWIEENVSPEIVDGVTRRELFRVSAENRLIDDVNKWMEFHRARNSTSHIYDNEIAEEVFQASLSFLPYAKDFVVRLEQRND
ncbi:nucleotidyltransferase substrate binding protein [Clostridium oryzae]|uniref:nucleotidyltransferase substrate binding protein n=1 Tax=Clostridium oryzae TaxID=1450648 RepID=UPI0009A514ED|nr:nucleotidyltransferase substrate binding protein [Clostridium oryzae]